MFSKILKNSSYILSAQVIIKIISFFYTLLLLKSLTVEDFGLYTVALSYFSLVSQISDFGVTRYILREVTRDQSKLDSIIPGILIFRIFSLALVFILFSVLILTFDPLKPRAFAVTIALLAIFPQAISITLDAFFLAVQKVIVSSLGALILSISTCLLGFFFLLKGYGLYGVITAFILGQFMYMSYLVFVYRKETENLLGRFSVKMLKEIISGSFPYALLGILGLLYFKIDSVLLSYIRGSYETGIYGAAYKFLEAVVFIPTAVSNILFPVLASLHDQSKSKVKKYYYKSLAIMFGLSLLLFLGYEFILPVFIKTYLPQFTPSIEAVIILALTIPFMFIHVPGAVVLLSAESYLKPVIYLSFFTVLSNIILNLIFIPQLGYIASSWITVFSEALSFIVFFMLLQLKVFNE